SDPTLRPYSHTSHRRSLPYPCPSHRLTAHRVPHSAPTRRSSDLGPSCAWVFRGTHRADLNLLPAKGEDPRLRQIGFASMRSKGLVVRLTFARSKPVARRRVRHSASDRSSPPVMMSIVRSICFACEAASPSGRTLSRISKIPPSEMALRQFESNSAALSSGQSWRTLDIT